MTPGWGARRGRVREGGRPAGEATVAGCSSREKSVRPRRPPGRSCTLLYAPSRTSLPMMTSNRSEGDTCGRACGKGSGRAAAASPPPHTLPTGGRRRRPAHRRQRPRPPLLARPPPLPGGVLPVERGRGAPPCRLRRLQRDVRLQVGDQQRLRELREHHPARPERGSDDAAEPAPGAEFEDRPPRDGRAARRRGVVGAPALRPGGGAELRGEDDGGAPHAPALPEAVVARPQLTDGHLRTAAAEATAAQERMQFARWAAARVAQRRARLCAPGEGVALADDAAGLRDALAPGARLRVRYAAGRQACGAARQAHGRAAQPGEGREPAPRASRAAAAASHSGPPAATARRSSRISSGDSLTRAAASGSERRLSAAASACAVSACVRRRERRSHSEARVGATRKRAARGRLRRERRKEEAVMVSLFP